MALIYQHSGTLGQHIAVWSISETYDELVLFLNNATFLKDIQELGLKSTIRIKQKLAAGILLQHLVKQNIEIAYDALGKPHLKNHSGYLSISNTKEFVAVIFHPEKPVGIDIEIPSERILKIAPKFVNKEEETWMNNSKNNPFQNCFVIWCVKESVFKLIGGGGIDFKEHIVVYEPKGNQGLVRILKPTQETLYNYYLWGLEKILVSHIVGN